MQSCGTNVMVFLIATNFLCGKNILPQLAPIAEMTGVYASKS